MNDEIVARPRQVDALTEEIAGTTLAQA